MWTDCLASAGLFFSPSSFCGFSHLALMLLGFVRTSSHLLPSCLSSLARPPVRSPCWGVCRDMHLLFTFFVFFFLSSFLMLFITPIHTYIYTYIHTCIPFRASLSIPVSPHPCIHISPRPSGLTSTRAPFLDRGRTLYFVPPPLQLLGFGLGFALDLGRLASFASGFVNSPFRPFVRPSGGFFFRRACLLVRVGLWSTHLLLSISFRVFSFSVSFPFLTCPVPSRVRFGPSASPFLFISSRLYVLLDAMALLLPV